MTEVIAMSNSHDLTFQVALGWASALVLYVLFNFQVFAVYVAVCVAVCVAARVLLPSMSSSTFRFLQ